MSPCRCLHWGSSLYSGWPHSAPPKSQASSSTSSLLSRWLSSGLHSRRGGGTVHLHNSKVHITYCAAVYSSPSRCYALNVGSQQKQRSTNKSCRQLRQLNTPHGMFTMQRVLFPATNNCGCLFRFDFGVTLCTADSSVHTLSLSNVPHRTYQYCCYIMQQLAILTVSWGCMGRPTWDDAITTGAIDQHLPLWTGTSGTRWVEQTHEITRHSEAWIWCCKKVKRAKRIICQSGRRWERPICLWKVCLFFLRVKLFISSVLIYVLKGVIFLKPTEAQG